jgi:hypothetical protein
MRVLPVRAWALQRRRRKEHLLDRLDPDCFAVEPDTVGLLRHEAPFRCGGGVIFEGEGQFSCRCVPADVFDLLVYFRTVQPSRLL